MVCSSVDVFLFVKFLFFPPKAEPHRKLCDFTSSFLLSLFSKCSVMLLCRLFHTVGVNVCESVCVGMFSSALFYVRHMFVVWL